MTGGCSACGAKKQTNNTNTYTKQKLKQQQQQTPASVIVSIKCSSTGGRNKSNQNLHPFACAERLRDHIAQQKLRRTKRIPFYTQKKKPFYKQKLYVSWKLRTSGVPIPGGILEMCGRGTKGWFSAGTW